MRRLTLIIISCTLLLATRGHAQDLQQSEAQADRWAQELVYQGKALGGYLACIRQTRDKVTIMRLVDKAVDVLRNRGTLLSRDALVIDSILEEVRPVIGKDVQHYLPLLEGRIIHSGNASGKYLREFQLMGEARSLRQSFEISLLDFRGMDLIVLSACQTAQGDITGDGVFGLQRGFKKAGANAILMSLWKVDDEATCLLMTEFYRYWLDGKSKHDALEAAKHAVRSHPEWEDPRYRAAFILLDGQD